MSFLPAFKTGLCLAFRARYFSLVISCLFVLIFATVLAAQFGGRQPAVVALDVGFSVIRLLLPLVLVLLAQELISHEFNRRYFLNSITYPKSRTSLLLGRFFAISLLVLGLLLVMAMLLAALIWLVGQKDARSGAGILHYHYLLVIFFIGLDTLLLIALASLLATVASTPSFVLIGTFGFLFVARSFSAIVELLTRDSNLVGDAEAYRSSLGLLAYLLPDLGALDIRMVALYGQLDFLPADWSWLLFSTLLYTAALMAFAVWALQRKHFA